MGIARAKVELYRPVIAAVLDDDVGKFVVKTTLKVLNRSKVLCPVDTGLLRASLGMSISRRVNRITGKVETKVKYALAVHNGRQAITIYPKHKKALAFWWHGKHWVVKSVHQPARKGRPFMYDALKEVAASSGFKMTKGSKYGPAAWK